MAAGALAHYFAPEAMVVTSTDGYNDGVQDCSNSSALAVELSQSCTKPLP